jgi:hypothetical protein
VRELETTGVLTAGRILTMMVGRLRNQQEILDLGLM